MRTILILLLAGAPPAFGQDYVTNPPDTPNVWATVRDSDGEVKGVYVAETWFTSEGVGDAPFSVPGAHTAVNTGVPSLAVLEAVYADILTATKRVEALANLNTYFLGRGWITTALTALSQYAQVPADKQLAARLWMLRWATATQHRDPCDISIRHCWTFSDASFLSDNLVIVNGAWAVP